MQKKIAAVIDIGTNSIRLLLGGINDNDIQVYNKQILTTRIGQGVHHNKLLSPKGMEDTINGLMEFVKKAKEMNASDIFCFATSAVRDADNKKDFTDEVFRRTGLTIEILDGNQEAEAGFLGAAGYSRQVLGVIDIGGGSTEIIKGCQGKILYSRSVNLGAVRAMENIPLGDPVDTEKIKEMQRWIYQNYMDHLETNHLKGIRAWTGIGGTITSLAAVSLKMSQYHRERLQNLLLERNEIYRLLHSFMDISLEERRKVIGLQPQRADIIIPGTLILLEFMELMDVQYIKVSDRDNLEGYLMQKI